MKYLKESEATNFVTYEFQEEFRDFCETNLAYILDDLHLFIGGNYLSIKKYDELDDMDIDEEIENTIRDPRLFNWVDIKDHFITFIIYLERAYNINDINFYGFPKEATNSYTTEGYWYNTIEIIEDDNIIPLIYSINIRVRPKKIQTTNFYPENPYWVHKEQ